MRIIDATLQCHDPALLAGFYGESLGLRVDRAPDTVIIHAGDSVLRFRRTAPSDAAPVYHFAWNVYPDQFDRVVAELVRLDLALPVPGEGSPVVRFESWQANSVYFRDPAGNIGEFIARERLADELVPTGSGPILPTALSEVGLVTQDVGELAELFAKELAAPRFSGNDVEFSAYGDDRGLAILSQAGRHWYPTDIPAEVFPVELTIAGDTERDLSVPGAPHVIRVRSTAAPTSGS